MDQQNNNVLIVICGPTAVGKTKFSIEIAKEFKSEIISADSRQLFKETIIGTAQPLHEEMEEIKHHFISSHSVKEKYNAGKYEEESLKLIEHLFLSKKTLILSGGSGLYINAVCQGFDEIPKANLRVRKNLEAILEIEGITGLQKLLRKTDPIFYQEADLKNLQRITRALEVCLSSGKPYSSFRQRNFKKRNFKIIKIGLNIERKELYERINKRVDVMMENGLLEEVRKLYEYKDLNALKTVGYKELFDYLDNKIDLETAVNKIKQNTRHFAKRQLTWFGKDKEIRWFSPEDRNEIVDYLKQEMNEELGIVDS